MEEDKKVKIYIMKNGKGEYDEAITEDYYGLGTSHKQFQNVKFIQLYNNDLRFDGWGMY